MTLTRAHVALATAVLQSAVTDALRGDDDARDALRGESLWRDILEWDRSHPVGGSTWPGWRSSWRFSPP